jgi:hypothetical protein
MADEVTTPVATPPSETTYINPDGSYKEGWKDALLPDDLKADKFFDSPFNANVKELLKTAGNQAKMLGKKGIVPVSEKSSEFEVKEYRKAMGVPDKYTYQKPAGVKALEGQDQVIENALGEFNKLNMSQSQVDAAMGFFNNFLKNVEVQDDQTKTKAMEEQDRLILTEENTAYETNTHYVDNVVRQFTQGWSDQDVLALFPTKESQKEGWDPARSKLLMRRFLVNAGKSIGEGRMVIGDTSGKSLQQQLDEVMKSPEYLSGTGKLHQDALQKALKLREQMNKQQGR